MHGHCAPYDKIASLPPTRTVLHLLEGWGNVRHLCIKLINAFRIKLLLISIYEIKVPACKLPANFMLTDCKIITLEKPPACFVVVFTSFHLFLSEKHFNMKSRSHHQCERIVVQCVVRNADNFSCLKL